MCFLSRFARFAALVSFLLAALGLFGAAHVHAQGPDPDIRIFHTREWYSQHQPEVATANNLHYYGGKVMHTSTTYAIYWMPSGHKIDKRYRTLNNRYFQDIGGSPFYNIVTQYYENPGQVHIANTSTFGGQWVDTVNAYPHAGTFNSPLTDKDIRNEVKRAIAANGWPTGYGTQFFVFTAKGINSCIDSTTCTPGTAHPAFCAYHGHFVAAGQDILYANMPYAATWGSSCGTFTKSPNGNAAADTEISIVSHEHFEAVTDADPPPGGPEPPTTAWTDSQGYEIGDKCAYTFGNVKADGSNLALNGHPYIIQLEWSNAAKNGSGGCAKSYAPVP